MYQVLHCTMLDFHSFCLKYRSERAFSKCDFGPKTLNFSPNWFRWNLKCPIFDRSCHKMDQNCENIENEYWDTYPVKSNVVKQLIVLIKNSDRNRLDNTPSTYKKKCTPKPTLPIILERVHKYGFAIVKIHLRKYWSLNASQRYSVKIDPSVMDDFLNS